jgi:ribosomal-protein-serine acetyltransferase
LTSGTLTEFDEQEIFEETKIVKNIASRFSEYRKTGIVFGQRFQVTGRKFFQFVKIDQPHGRFAQFYGVIMKN